MEKILVFGHQKPDTDTVTSAIVLSYLKNKLGMNSEPRVLGNINNETKFVLDYFKVKTPKFLNDVRLQIKDVDYTKNCFLKENNSIFDGYKYMNETKISTIPVINSKGKYLGAISMKTALSNLIEGNLNKLDTSYDNLLEALNGKEILRFDKEIKGNILTAGYRSTTFKEKVEINKESVLIVGDRHSIIEYAVENSASIIILTNGVKMKEEHLKIAKKNHVDVISTDYNTLIASNLVVLSNFVKTKLETKSIITINENDPLSEVLELANKKKYSNYPVLDNENNCLGVFRVSTAYSRHPKQVMLVDHNEKEQSVIGLDEADIIEIVDHHKIGNIGTTMPINFRNMPLGCTETILYLMYKENNVEIPKKIAGLMMSGIISDTLLLSSPTTTDIDKKALKELSKIAKVDYKEYGMEMFKAGSSIKGKSISEIIRGDFKNFMVDNQKVGIGQVSTMSTDEILSKQKEFINQLNKDASEEDYTAIALFVTDILKNGSYIFFNENSKEIFAKSFGIENLEEGYFFEGLVSRKKQIVPKIMNYMDN
ncbi:MAG: putative manganese-dependent inorganic diphosphatase [Bacilli bacterium]|nr:putative manganese-dependent inorganic diphosphatase [Bacilli bacterium]